MVSLTVEPQQELQEHYNFFFFVFLSVVVVDVVAISWAAPMAYGDAQARG